MSRGMIRRMVVGGAFAVGVLVSTGGTAVATPVVHGALDEDAARAMEVSADDPPPLGNGSEGSPYAPCGPDNDGQRYLTRDARGYSREYICSLTDGAWDWLEIFRA
jgi:hypothetical protein